MILVKKNLKNSHHAFVVGRFYNLGNYIKGAKVISGMIKTPYVHPI